MIKIKTNKVDGESRVGLWINDKFIDEIECNSQLSPKEARAMLREDAREYCEKNKLV